MNQIGRAVMRVGQVYSLEHRLTVSTMRLFTTGVPSSNQAMPLPSLEKVYSEKITKIVDDISTLNLLEVADLNALLKARLNISDAPVMMAGAASAPVAKVEEEEEAAAPVAVQTSFTVKLTKFDPAKKVAIIKEIKSLVEGMNLVQAKKFVESAPAVVRADVAKDEAEKVKEALIAVGGECEIE
jgi:large subunit ribosomal protein L7/L12